MKPLLLISYTDCPDCSGEEYTCRCTRCHGDFTLAETPFGGKIMYCPRCGQHIQHIKDVKNVIFRRAMLKNATTKSIHLLIVNVTESFQNRIVTYSTRATNGASLYNWLRRVRKANPLHSYRLKLVHQSIPLP